MLTIANIHVSICDRKVALVWYELALVSCHSPLNPCRFLETLHVIFCLKFIYFYTVTGFGNFNALVQVDW